MFVKNFCVTTMLLLFISAINVDAENYPVDTSYTIQKQLRKYIKKYPYLIPAKDQTASGISEFRDVVYATLEETKYGKRELHADIFSPDKNGTYPVIILVHGGAWQSGNKKLLVPLAQLLAKKGFVTVAVEYQLGLEAPYPAAVHNIKAAVRYMRANCHNYHVNPDKIVIAGTSAGGHLAALVGLTNGVEKMEGNMGNNDVSSRVQAIVDIDGVLSFLSATMLNATRAVNSPDINWIGGTFEEEPHLWKEVSPVYYVNEKSVPILFLGSGYPRYLSGMDELIGMYEDLGIYYDVHEFDVEMHTFWLFHPFVDMTATRISSFLRKVFGEF